MTPVPCQSIAHARHSKQGWQSLEHRWYSVPWKDWPCSNLDVHLFFTQHASKASTCKHSVPGVRSRGGPTRVRQKG
eukprot:5327727-Amphidinium_carterae.1